jgi:hypothetical protein
MTGTDRFASISALLQRAKQDLFKIEQEYKNALSAKEISAELRIDIKNFCGNLRSALDYLAREVRAVCSQSLGGNEKLYFPIAVDRTSFEGTMRRSFPDLEGVNKPLWNLLESVQPYNGEQARWLSKFNRLNNENKHNDLVEQTRTEIEQIRVHTHGGGLVSWTPGSVRFGSGVFISGVPVDPRTQMPVPHPSQRVEKVVWVDFRFRDIDDSALALLRASMVGTERICNEVENLL